jgi:hypothetical protein
MKRVLLYVLLLCVVSAGFAAAESLDKVWIVQEDTGSASTMVRLDNPDLSPNQTIEVYIEESGLAVRWGEGYVNYTYTYYSDMGKEIWTSKRYSEKKRTGDDTWTLKHTQKVTLPGNIPDGKYRIGFAVSDYHSKKVYKGNASFTVGQGGGSAPAVTPRTADSSTPQAPVSGGSGEFVGIIDNVKLSLTGIETTRNRFTLHFVGVNEGSTDQDLRNYACRMISTQGKEYTYAEYGGGGALRKWMRFPPNVPMKTEIYFERPVPDEIKGSIKYFEMTFWSEDDTLILRDVPVPYSTR